MLRVGVRFAAVLVCLATTSASPASEVPWPVGLRHDLDRVSQIQWRLRRAANDRCSVIKSDIGVIFDHRQAYDPRDWGILESTLGMATNPVLAGVAIGGPAAQAGLVPGDEVLSIGSKLTADIIAERREGETAAEVLDRWIADSPADRPIRMVTRRGGLEREVPISPVSHCGIRIVLKTSGKVDAHSDGRDVAVTNGLMAFSGSDDELALAAAHEFGHAMAGHMGKVTLAERRQREDQADIAGIRLVACAGFDPAKAMVLYERLARRDVLAFLRAPTHRKYSARIQLMKGVLAKGEKCPQS